MNLEGVNAKFANLTTKVKESSKLHFLNHIFTKSNLKPFIRYS